MSDLRSRFEDVIYKSNTSLSYILLMCCFDEKSNDYSGEVHEYSLGCLNGAWWMFQEINK